MFRRIYYRRFRVSTHKTCRVRIDPEASAARLSAILERFEAAAADYRARPDDENTVRVFVQAICALCICIFGEDTARRIIEGWNGNYLGLAAELSRFCQHKLASVLRHFAIRSARRYRRGRLL